MRIEPKEAPAPSTELALINPLPAKGSVAHTKIAY